MKMLLRSIRHVFRILNIYIKEVLQSLRYTGFVDENLDSQKWRLLLLAHSLEKGLFLSDKKPDFGIKKARDLLSLLKKYQEHDDCFEYDEAYCVLVKYKKYREDNNLKTDFLNQVSELKKNSKVYKAGCKIIRKDELQCNFNEFSELCKKRHSIREFASSYPSLSDIIEVIEIASQAPSACNRQMIKVFFSEEVSVNSKLAQFIPGNSGTRNEKAIYMFITADRTSFDYFESEQWLLNGGIFISYLVLGLTAKEIGSCIYQWPIQYINSYKVKHILNIPNQYTILSVIGIGKYKEKMKILECSRKRVEEYYQLKR